jgi:hypothetical protein
MSAFDTFEWFISSTIHTPTPEILRTIREHREYLLALRSEDERQRFVNEVIEEMREQHRHDDRQRATLGG